MPAQSRHITTITVVTQLSSSLRDPKHDTRHRRTPVLHSSFASLPDHHIVLEGNVPALHTVPDTASTTNQAYPGFSDIKHWPTRRELLLNDPPKEGMLILNLKIMRFEMISLFPPVFLQLSSCPVSQTQDVLSFRAFSQSKVTPESGKGRSILSSSPLDREQTATEEWPQTILESPV